MSSALRQSVRDSGCERTLRTGGGNYKGQGEVREKGQIRGRQTDGRQEDERGRGSERVRQRRGDQRLGLAAVAAHWARSHREGT